jgi:hypothetical protein
VVKTTRDELTKYNKEKIIIDNEQNIKDAIRAIGENHVIEHAVFKLLCKQIANTPTPLGLSAVIGEER